MRIVRQYDITNDKFPSRTMACTYKTAEAATACRLANQLRGACAAGSVPAPLLLRNIDGA